MQDNEKKERTAVLRTCARREECTQEIFLITKYIIFSLILCSVLCVLNFAEGAKFGYYATCFCFVN